jgi:hypothetical protein
MLNALYGLRTPKPKPKKARKKPPSTHYTRVYARPPPPPLHQTGMSSERHWAFSSPFWDCRLGAIPTEIWPIKKRQLATDLEFSHRCSCTHRPRPPTVAISIPDGSGPTAHSQLADLPIGPISSISKPNPSLPSQVESFRLTVRRHILSTRRHRAQLIPSVTRWPAGGGAQSSS